MMPAASLPASTLASLPGQALGAAVAAPPVAPASAAGFGPSRSGDAARDGAAPRDAARFLAALQHADAQALRLPDALPSNAPWQEGAAPADAEAPEDSDAGSDARSEAADTASQALPVVLALLQSPSPITVPAPWVAQTVSQPAGDAAAEMLALQGSSARALDAAVAATGTPAAAADVPPQPIAAADASAWRAAIAAQVPQPVAAAAAQVLSEQFDAAARISPQSTQGVAQAEDSGLPVVRAAAAEAAGLSPEAALVRERLLASGTLRVAVEQPPGATPRAADPAMAALAAALRQRPEAAQPAATSAAGLAAAAVAGSAADEAVVQPPSASAADGDASIFATQPRAGGDTSPAASAVQGHASAGRTQQPLVDALGDRIEWQLRRGSEHATIRLDPPLQGQLEISIRRDAGALQVHLQASSSEVVRQLQAIGDTLRQDLSSRQSGDVAVVVSHAAHRDGGDGRGRQGQERADAGPADPGRALAEAETGQAPERFSLFSPAR